MTGPSPDRPAPDRAERLSRIAFAVETALITLPVLAYAIPLTVMAGCYLLPATAASLIGLAFGGTGAPGDIGRSLAGLGLGLVGLAGLLALSQLILPSIAFLRHGRPGLARARRYLRRGLWLGLPVMAGMWAIAGPNLSWDQPWDLLLAVVLTTGLPLLVPIAHLAHEMRQQERAIATPARQPPAPDLRLEPPPLRTAP